MAKIKLTLPVIGSGGGSDPLKLDKGGYEGTAQDLNNSIKNIAFPDQVLKIGEIVITGLNAFVSAGDFQWRLNQVDFLTAPEFSEDIDPATDGFNRTDILEGDNAGIIHLKKGVESESASPEPSVTAGRIRLAGIPVFGSTIGTPSLPIVGDNYISKREKSAFQVYQSGEINNTVLDDFFYGYLNFRDAVTNLKSIGTYTNAHLYSGRELLIKNSQATDITIYHLTGTGFQFSFPNEVNFILKPNEIIRFSTKILSPTSGILEYVGVVLTKADIGLSNVENTSDLNKPVSTLQQAALDLKANLLDAIPLTGTTVGNPVSGEIEVLETAKGIWSKGGSYPDDYSGIFLGEGTSGLYFRNLFDNNEVSIKTYDSGVVISDNRLTAIGLSGLQDFSPNITDLDYPQKIYVDTGLSSKLDASAYNEYFKGKYTSSGALTTAYPTATDGDYAIVDAGTGVDAKEWIWDNEAGWIVGGATGASTTDALPEGSTNLYFTVARFLANLTYTRVITALGFTPENVANKSNSYTVSSTTTYASTKAIVDGLATKQNTLTNPITGTGTTNYIPKFTASGTVGNSNITDNGSLVSVNSLSEFKGTAASDGGQLGSELTTTATGTNWTGTGFATGYTHTTGDVTPLVSTLAAVANNLYQITYTITGRTTGSITINFGGIAISGITASGNSGPKTTSTATLNIVPTTDFNGTVALSIKVISPSVATITFKNSSGVVTNEIRAHSNNTNFSIGIGAGKSNTTGNFNSAIGQNALQNNTTGSYNSAVGTSALTNNTTGGGNSAVGFTSLTNNTTGVSNSAVGASALLNNTTGAANSAVGYGSLQNNTTGSSNSAVGYGSGRYIANKSTPATILNNSIMLGSNTSPLADNQTNQIVIGDGETGLGSNSTILGNSSTTKTAIRGRLLSGTTTDNGTDQLQVNGTISATGGTLSTAPTTSAGTYDILTRNTSTGVVEKVAALGYTPENVANKATNFTTINNTLYPTVQAVNEFAVAKVVNTKSTTPIVGGALNARMCVSNGMLYVTEYTNNKIGVFSLENPMSPTKIYEFTVGDAPRHVVVSGRNLFVACHDANTVEVWDIQNPESAYKIGTINTGLQPKMFQLLGEYLYVVCFGTSKLEKYKITMPDSSLSTFSYYKVNDVSVGLNPLAVSYNGDGLIAVCGNGDNVIKILSTDDLNVASSATFGGAGHGTCSWYNKTQLLVTDWTTESLLSIDYSNLSSPVLSSSITVSENPEQIEIIGNKAYIPSLRIATSPSYLDFIDLSDAKLPVKTKSETLTVNAAGFTATYTDGVNNYIYVDGHEAPFNIDAIKIELGDTHRQENTMRDIAYVNRLGVANLSTTTVDESKKYTNNSNPYTVSGIDNVLRLESGTTTLPNPNSVRDGKIVVISNVSNSGNVTVVNPFLGFSSLVLYPYESISVQSSKNGATYKWDAVGNRRNLPNIFDNGNVGIGTTNPSSYLNYRFLSVNGSDGSVLQLRKGDVIFGEVGGDGTFVNFDTFGGAYSKFSISGTEKLKIESSAVTASVPVFAPTAAPGTNTTQIATTAFVLANSSTRPYKVYTALLSQSGTSAPTATVLENTLGGTIVWTRFVTGQYIGTLTGAFTASKTAIFVTRTNPSAVAFDTNIGANAINADTIGITTFSNSAYVDSQLSNTSIEIRVYN